MYEIVQYIFTGLIFCLTFFVVIKQLVNLMRSKYGKLHTVKARVVDKHTVESFSKYKGNGKNIRYVVVFEIAGKKKGFYVSEFSYSGYRTGETGTLQYRGDRIVDFH